jgi:hypothetical protein
MDPWNVIKMYVLCKTAVVLNQENQDGLGYDGRHQLLVCVADNLLDNIKNAEDLLLEVNRPNLRPITNTVQNHDVKAGSTSCKYGKVQIFWNNSNISELHS